MNRTTNPQGARRSRPRLRPRRRARRGFTLIEIIVALSAGLLVSMAAFSMSKNATAFFQHEARISSAQLALTLGMNRLTGDIQRAAFLATPNSKADPLVCRDASWTAAPGLQSFAGLTIKAGAVGAGSQAAGNGVIPDQVIVGGSLNGNESFIVGCVLPGSGGAPALQLWPATLDGAMARLQAGLGAGETAQAKLALIFAPGRFVNILDPTTGVQIYSVVGAAPVVTAGVAVIQLATTVSVPKKPASFCGMLDPSVNAQCGAGLMVSAVSRVLYDIRSLAGVPGSSYAALTAPITPLVTGDAGRTELVRVELDPAGNEIPATLELVSEYAVDMRFGITASTKIANDNYNPTVTAYGIGDANVYTIAGDVGTVTSTPQLVRSVQVRLATRTRAPDRNTDLVKGADGRRLHYLIGANFSPSYARVRTSYANVSLPNQGGFSLW